MLRSSFIYFIIIVIAMVIFSSFFSSSRNIPKGSLSDIIDIARDRKSVNIVQDGNTLTLTSKDGQEIMKTSFVGSTEELYRLLKSENVSIGKDNVDIVVKQKSQFDWGTILIQFLPLLLFGALLFFMLRNAQGANSQALSFGRSRARMTTGTKPTINFSDVAGVEEAKQDLQEIVDFLKSPQKFIALGARIPRGVLLVGPPGTGKTLLARAVAGEAGVPFFSISGSEFVEMFVGVGASRVRDLFDQAKRHSPCIIFVDEIDAVGRHRGAGLGGGHDEREQTLNQILVEMDGFDSSVNVIVMAATNRPDILDPALLRPGRFDRQVVLDRPDIEGRKAILGVHIKGKPLAEDVKLDVLAKLTPGFSGADLANLLNEAALLAARRNKKAIAMNDLEESMYRVVAGPEKRSRIISPKEKENTAYHEAGHALVAHSLPNADPVHRITIIPRGFSMGHTLQLPVEDRYSMSRSQFKDSIAVYLGGRVAEELIFNEMTTGARHDLEQATKSARKMVTEYGMSDRLGPRTFGHKEELVFLGREISEQRNYSDKIAEEIDEEVASIIGDARQQAIDILTRKKATLVKIAEYLVTNETAEGEALKKLFEEETTGAETPQALTSK